MKPYKHFPYDSMFIKPEERAATSRIPDKKQKIDAGLRNVLNHVRQEPDFNRARNFQDNLEYIHDWDQREMLGLIIDGVDLHETSFHYLDHWRANYQMPPED